MKAFKDVESTTKTRGGIIVMLVGAENYIAWRRSLTNAYFALTKKKGDISKIKIKDMIDYKYYTEKHTKFSKEFNKLTFKGSAKKSSRKRASKVKLPAKPVLGTPAKGPGMKRANAAARAAHILALDAYNVAVAAAGGSSSSSDSSASSDSSSSSGSSDASDGGRPVVHDQLYDDWLASVWEHARSDEGRYSKWVAHFWLMIQNSLCESIQEDISGVARGDIPTALIKIQIALGRFETMDANNLLIEFTGSKFTEEGKNSWLTYDNHMRLTYNRILAVDPKLVTDKTAQCSLVHGLKVGPQAIHFAYIIRKYGEGQAASYEALRAIISKHVAQPMIMDALHKLRPMTTAGIHLTDATQSPKTKRISELTVLLANATKAPLRASTTRQANVRPCYDYLKGSCSRPNCRFSHAVDQKTSKDAAWCDFHKNSTHNTSDCRVVAKQQLAVGDVPSAVPGIQAKDMSRKQLISYVEQLHASNQSFTIAMLVHQPQLVAAAACDLKPDDFIMDNAATTHCIKNLKLISPGSLKPCGMDLKGLGSLKTTETGDVLLQCEGDTKDSVSGVLQLTNAPCSEQFPANIISEPRLRQVGILPTVRCVQEGVWLNGKIVGAIHEARYHNSEGKFILKARTNASGLLIACVKPAAVENVNHQVVAASINVNASTANTAMEHWDKAYHQALLACLPKVADAIVLAALMDPDLVNASEEQLDSAIMERGNDKFILPKLTQAQRLAKIVAMHLRRAHLHFPACARLCRVDPKEYLKLKCLACQLSKPTFIVHDKVASEVSKRRGSVISADYKGKFAQASICGAHGYYSILDTFEGMIFIRMVKAMSDWCEIWQAFVAFLEAHEGHDKVVAVLLTDAAPTFIHCGKCAEFNRRKGIMHRSSATESQWGNSVERPQATVFKWALAQMIHSGFSEVFKEFWSFSVETAAFALNCLPYRQPDRTRLDSFRERNPQSEDQVMRYLHPFGCLCFMKVVDQAVRLDFDPRAIPCYYLGYDWLRKSFILLDMSSRRVLRSINVRFADNVFPARTNNPLTIAAGLAEFGNNTGVSSRLSTGVQVPLSYTDNTLPISQPSIADSVQLGDAPLLPGYSKRGYLPSEKALQNLSYANMHLAQDSKQECPSGESQIFEFVLTASFDSKMSAYQREVRTPANFKQAIACADKAIWLNALKDAFKMLDEYGCLGKPMSARPEKFVRFLFVPKIKNGDLLDRADLRPTLRGDLMQKHVHFEDTTAPVARTESYKLACILAVQLNLTAFIGDVPKAFYGSEPDIKGIMALCPPGYPLDDAGELRDFQAPPLYAEVERMIPGFPQSSRVFNFDLVKKLVSIRWTQTVNDPCVFLPPPGKRGIVIFHVDDISAFLPDEKCAELFYGPEGLGKYWPTLTFRLMDKALGIAYVSNYTLSSRSIFMHQKDYAEAMLERFKMADCKPASTPAPPGLRYSKKDCEDKSTGDDKIMTQSQFLSIIMSVSWLAVNTRFDLKFALSKLSSYVAAPGLLHKKALQHLLRYIKATVHYGIEFLSSGPLVSDENVLESLDLITYTDASHHDDVDSSASTIAFVNFLNGSPISMCSKLTKEVKSSVNHGEVFAVAEALPSQSESIIAVNKSQRDAIWISNMLAEMIGVSREVMPPTPILIDNTGALKLIQDAIQHTANKQILHHLHELRERISAGRFYAIKVSTDDNLADAGTKQLATAEASRRMLAFLAAPLGKRPVIVHASHIIDAMFKARHQWQASRPMHAHSSERIGEASHPGPTDVAWWNPQHATAILAARQARLRNLRAARRAAPAAATDAAKAPPHAPAPTPTFGQGGMLNG